MAERPAAHVSALCIRGCDLAPGSLQVERGAIALTWEKSGIVVVLSDVPPVR